MRKWMAIIFLSLNYVWASFALGNSACSDYFLEADPYLDYESIYDPQILDWVRLQNEKSLDRLTQDPRYSMIYKNTLDRMNSSEKLVYASFFKNTDRVRNFWKDGMHKQGVLRESTREQYFSGKANWDIVLDFDKLSKTEGRTWVFRGTTYPFEKSDIAMIALSDSGKDSVEYREFDMMKKQFVENGFYLPESKSRVQWLDDSTLMVADAFSQETQTDSGYPRLIKLWRRGTPYENAEILFEVGKENLSVSPVRVRISKD